MSKTKTVIFDIQLSEETKQEMKALSRLAFQLKNERAMRNIKHIKRRAFRLLTDEMRQEHSRLSMLTPFAIRQLREKRDEEIRNEAYADEV